MKYTKHLALSLASLLILGGCNSSSNSESEVKTTTIQGTTTLSKAFVCIDTNANNTCDDSESPTISSDKGEYEITYNGVLEDGATLIAEGGYNLVLTTDNTNADSLTFKAAYSAQRINNNINVMTTLIAGKMASGSTHSEAVAYFANKYSDNGITESTIEANPLLVTEDDTYKGLFLTVHAIEDRYTQPAQAVTFRDANTTISDSNATGTIITEDGADNALFDYDIFDFDLDAFINQITQYFDYLYNLVVCTISGTCDDNGTLVVELTDAPGDYQAVYVTINEILVHLSGSNDVNTSEETNTTNDDNTTTNNSGWISVATPHKTLDLLTLQNGLTEAMGEKSLSVGKYTQLRLVIGDTADNNVTHPFANYLVFTDTNATEELKVPSDKIKSNHNFEIIGGEAITMTIDFDANKSIHQSGDKWTLSPSISIKTRAGSAE